MYPTRLQMWKESFTFIIVVKEGNKNYLLLLAYYLPHVTTCQFIYYDPHNWPCNQFQQTKEKRLITHFYEGGDYRAVQVRMYPSSAEY